MLERAGADFLLGGYFFTDIGSSLRVVSLNTIYFFDKNDYACNCSDPTSLGAQELVWVQRLIEESLQDKHYILFIGHIPPSNWLPDCMTMFFQLIERTAQSGVVIQGSIFGHLHGDQVQLWPSTTGLPNSSSIGVSYCAPSVVPSFNPAVRSYSYDLQSKPGLKNVPTLLNWNQFYYSLNQSAAFAPIMSRIPFQLQFEYSPVESYSLPNLSLRSWDAFFNNLPSDQQILQLYNKHVFVSSPEPIPGTSFCKSPQCS